MSTLIEVQKIISLGGEYEIVLSGAPVNMGSENIQACVNDAIRHLRAFQEYQRAVAIPLDPESIRELRNVEFQAREDFLFNMYERGIQISGVRGLSEQKETANIGA